MAGDDREANIHLLIADEINRELQSPDLPQKYRKAREKELAYEKNALKSNLPSQGMYVLTKFGQHIDPIRDVYHSFIRNGKLPRKDSSLDWKERKRFEQQRTDLINTKLPHILDFLQKHYGGAMTYEILDRETGVWLTPYMQFYSITGKLMANKKGKVREGNKTLQWFKELLKWPGLEPVLEFVRFEPDAKTFRTLSFKYESLGDMVRSAIKYGFKCNFVRRGGEEPSYYAIALPEATGDGKLRYEPDKTSHYALLELCKDGLATELRFGENYYPIESDELIKRIDAHGKKYFEQRREEANAYRKHRGLEEII